MMKKTHSFLNSKSATDALNDSCRSPMAQHHIVLICSAEGCTNEL